MKSYKTETFPLQTLDKRIWDFVVLWEIKKYILSTIKRNKFKKKIEKHFLNLRIKN